jgi:hypothetical protein
LHPVIVLILLVVVAPEPALVSRIGFTAFKQGAASMMQKS